MLPVYIGLALALPSAIVAIMLARAAAVLDDQDEAELQKYRDLTAGDIGEQNDVDEVAMTARRFSRPAAAS